MEIRLEILRRPRGRRESFVQTFLYEAGDPAATAATALTELNERVQLRDAEGNPAAPIRWDCGCLQKKCGACAMVINGRPRLACDARLWELGERVRLEPLKKFPVIEDLMVDRGILFEDLRTVRLWLEEDAAAGEQTNDGAYEASRCLQCGCCLEVCPNFLPGGPFTGMAAAVPMSRLIAELPRSQRKEMSRLYRKHVYEGCGKSLACREICPAGIDVDGLLARSAAAAVWKRFPR